MIQCQGITRAGKRCAVTSKSNWTIDSGTLVAGPLLKGGEFCLLHSKPFLAKASEVEDFEQMVIFVVDLETTGTDITKDRIVELAAAHAHSDSRMDCESFATTIQVDGNIVMERGMTNEDTQQSPSFAEVWYRFEKWAMDVMKPCQT